MTERGRLRFYDEARGFGFIVPDDGGADVYIMERIWRNCPDTIRRDDRVAYELGAESRGRAKASRIRLE